MHLLVCYLNIIGKFTRADIYDSYVEEKQPVISLTGDPFDFWSTTTLSEAEKVGFKSLFLFVGLFFLEKEGVRGQEDRIRQVNFPIQCQELTSDSLTQILIIQALQIRITYNTKLETVLWFYLRFLRD